MADFLRMNQKNSFYKNTLRTTKSRVAKRADAASSQLSRGDFVDVVGCHELALGPIEAREMIDRSGSRRLSAQDRIRRTRTTLHGAVNRSPVSGRIRVFPGEKKR